MLRKFLNMLLGMVVVSVLLFGGLVVFAKYVTRTLPWQHPVLDTQRPPDPDSVGAKGVLIFSKTNGFRHESIEAGVEALKREGQKRGWDVRTTENGAFFNDDYLQRFKVVVFLSTTGDVLTEEQERSLEFFVETGGGYAGIHAAADTEADWPWYHRMLGAHFRDHTLFPRHTPWAEVVTETRDHPATRHLPPRWRKRDEWYNFTRSVRGLDSARVLLRVNDSSYTARFPKAMGLDHPISWTKVTGDGRVFYTALGHGAETFAEPFSLRHMVEGIAWAGRF